MDRRSTLLRRAFLAGAITDALAVERAFVAPLTVLIIYGLVATEIATVHAGALPAARMLPTWVLQAGLLGLFVGAYHYPALARQRAA